MHIQRLLTILVLCVFAASNPVPANAGYAIKRHQTAQPNSAAYTVPLPKDRSKSGALAYLSAGCALLGLAIVSPGMSLFLILLGTAAGVFGKIGLKAYRGRTFLRVLCIVGIILGAVVLLLGMVPLIFLTL